MYDYHLKFSSHFFIAILKLCLGPFKELLRPLIRAQVELPLLAISLSTWS